MSSLILLTFLVFFGFSSSSKAQSILQYDANGNLANISSAIIGPPQIVSGSINQVVTVGSDVSLYVNAVGIQPILFQWYQNGAAISNATNSSLFLSHISTNNSGVYAVIVSNPLGTATNKFTVLVSTGNLVQNPGFETGTFSGWTVASPYGGPYMVGSGLALVSNFAADWGESSPGDTISQTVPTIAGQTYQFSFWLNTLKANGGANFTATWGGIPVLQFRPAGTFGWSNYFYTVTATGPTTISFTGDDAPGGFQMDDVVVQPTPNPATVMPIPAPNWVSAGNSMQFLLKFAGSSSTPYSVLASTNLSVPPSNWISLGHPLFLSNNLYQFVDPQSTNLTSRFYLLRSP